MVKKVRSLTVTAVVCGGVCVVPAGVVVAQEQTEQAESASTPEAPVTNTSETAPDSAMAAEDMDDAGDEAQDIDERFETEGYVGGYVALLQQTVPTLGLTGSLFVDDDFQLGLDLWRGSSKSFFGSFKTQGAALWGAWELSDSLWFKTGLSYSKLERPTEQEPLSVLTKGEDNKLAAKEQRNDSLGLDVGFGQSWSAAGYSIAVDYFGFTVPALRLTGEKLPTYSLQLGRVAMLYNIE